MHTLYPFSYSELHQNVITNGKNMILLKLVWLYFKQEVLVGMVTYTAKVMALTRPRWAPHCLITVLVAVLAMKSSAQMSRNGVTPEVPPFSSLLPTSVPRITPYQTTMVVGVTLLVLTLISPCQCFLKLLNIVPELFPFLTVGNFSFPQLFFNLLFY